MAKNKYPFIFVHGMFGWGMDEGLDKKFPYWGATTGNLMDFLAENDYEGYALSVGPVSSAWDRACEIYARLMGTTVDYGKAHSARHNHRRFGRTYDKPLFEGGVSSERKIHLIGHSHGGITVRLLLHLLTDGDPEERAASGPDDISGLFTGGKGDWVQSITCICTPHNGTVSFDVAKKLISIWSSSASTTPQARKTAMISSNPSATLPMVPTPSATICRAKAQAA